MNRRFGLAALTLLVVAGCGSSTSVSSAGYGSPAPATKADRTVAVNILPSLRYDPAALSVRPGETVVFKVTNEATAVHEFVLGDTKVQGDYQKMMAGMGSAPMTMRDQANVVDVQPGQTKQLAWTFPTSSKGSVIYGSHQPGDYAHGLKGIITVGGPPAPASPTTTGPSTTMGNMPGMRMPGKP